MSPITKTSTYRQRGYKSKITGSIEIVYSSDPAPVGDQWVLEWDNQVVATETTIPTEVAPASGAV
jgi:ABC-type phosphate transport system substrate-binding protein